MLDASGGIRPGRLTDRDFNVWLAPGKANYANGF